MFFDDFIAAIKKRAEISTLEELFKRPDANANAQEFSSDNGDSLVYAVVSELRQEVTRLLPTEDAKRAHENLIISYIDFLIIKGANINLRDPLASTLLYSNMTVANYLIQKGAHLTAKAFSNAVSQDNFTMIDRFLKLKFDINSSNKQVAPILLHYYFYFMKDVKMLQFLLDRGASVLVSEDSDSSFEIITKTPISKAYVRVNSINLSSIKQDKLNKKALNILINAAKKQIFDEVLKMLKNSKVSWDWYALAYHIVEMVAKLAGKNNVFSNDFKESKELEARFLDFLMKEVYEPVMQALKTRDDKLLAFNSGGHKDLGKDSALTLLYKNVISSPNILSFIKEMSGFDDNPFATKPNSSPFSGEVSHTTLKKN